MAIIDDGDRADIRELIAEFSEPIIYRRYTGTTKGNQVEGKQDTPNYESDPNITGAMVRNLNAEEILTSGGAYVLGDKEFTLIADTEPKREDRIVYRCEQFRPIRIDPMPVPGLNGWEIKGRKE